jgi:hypothetical protein
VLPERRRRDDIHAVGRRDLSVVGVEDDQGLDRSALGDERCPQARLRLARDEAAQAGVPRDRAEARRRRSRVQRDVGGACLQDPVNPDKRLERLVEIEADPVAVPDRACRE